MPQLKLPGSCYWHLNKFQFLEVVRTFIEGELAKVIFEQLKVESYVLPGQDGEQITKDARGVTCGHFSGTKKYFCAVDFAPSGI
jgi:hypothetical protein